MKSVTRLYSGVQFVCAFFSCFCDSRSRCTSPDVDARRRIVGIIEEYEDKTTQSSEHEAKSAVGRKTSIGVPLKEGRFWGGDPEDTKAEVNSGTSTIPSGVRRSFRILTDVDYHSCPRPQIK